MGHKSRWTLPAVVHPETYRKFVICVPNERFYIAAFQGLLIELTYSKNWQRDTAHTAAIVSRVWQEALESVLCDDCGEIIVTPDMEYEMSICELLRFQNGKLQGFCCGEWVDITGQGTLPPNGGDQPGGGTEQPGPGECVTYHGKMNASNQWYLPTVLNDGDTVELTNAVGAGNDGTLSPWHCPDGSTFFAGACIGGTGGPSGGDPDSSADHMELIMNIDGTWYEPIDGVITVSGGVVNGSAYIQVNDSDITDNAGSYTFDVEVCNNAAVGWERVIDFALTNGLFVSSSFPGYTGGVWVPGTGWQATDETDGVNWARHLNFGRNWGTPVTLTYIEFDYTVTRGPELAPLDDEMYTNSTLRDSHGNSSGTFVLDYTGSPLAAQTRLDVSIYVSQQATMGALSGQVTATKVILRGTGTPPF